MTQITISRSKLKDKLPLIIEGIANDFTNVLVRLSPVDTGHLRNSITYRKVQYGYEISMPYYSLYLEYGTPPHIIRPKDKKALSWTEGKGGGGQRYFAKVVHHPGTRPQPFIRPAFDLYLKDIIIQNLKRHLA